MVSNKMKGIDRRLEMKEREERRNNILIRRMEEGEGDIRERVENNVERFRGRSGGGMN